MDTRRPAASPSPRGAPGVARRQLLRVGAGVAAFATAAGLTPLAAMAAGTTRTASAPKHLFVSIGFINQTSFDVMKQTFDPWLAKNRGVQIQLSPNANWQNANVAQILAGTGPDVFQDWVLPLYTSHGLTMDLRPLVTRDNINLSIFDSAQLAYMSSGPVLHALPMYLHLAAPAVNMELVDQLGLKEPQPDWTHADWMNFAESLTVHSSDPSKARTGFAFMWGGYDSNGGNVDPYLLKGFGAEYVDPAENTRCYLTAPGAAECFQWAYDAIRRGSAAAGVNGGVFRSGQLAVTQYQTDETFTQMLPWYAAGMQWQVFPGPVFPKGRTAYVPGDFLAINAATKEPELAWDLLKFMSVERTWQIAMMRRVGWGPNQKDLWSDWVQFVQAVAPPLRTKNMQVFADQVLNNEPYPGLLFRYEDSQAASLINTATGKALPANGISVLTALQQATAQVNALEAAGAAVQAEANKVLSQIDALNTKTGPARLPAPPVKGVGDGNPATAQPSYALVNQSTGTYTLLADGHDVWNLNDDCVYACAPTNRDQGQWIARIVAISNVNCPNLSGWTKVGLMARGSLGDSAAMVFFAATGGNGIAFQERPIAGGNPSGINGNNASTGLIGARYLTVSTSSAAANYLIKPVWLKLVRKGTIWTGYTSFDGKGWAEAGSTVVEMSSAWIGLFATSHNGDFGDKGYARGVFDHLSFTPTGVYQIGVTGVPPAAGAVPQGWATVSA